MKPSIIAKKLTPPPIETLSKIAQTGSESFYEKYRPALRLLDLGLVTIKLRRLSSPLWEITDLGKHVHQETRKKVL